MEHSKFPIKHLVVAGAQSLWAPYAKRLIGRKKLSTIILGGLNLVPQEEVEFLLCKSGREENV